VSTDVSAVRTVNRISDILNCFTREQPALSLTTISNRLELPKSTVHRLLTALESQGFLMREANGRDFQLGYQLLHWGMVAQCALDLRNEALPFLRKLSASTGETAILSVRDGLQGVCLEMVASSQPVRLTMQAGQRLMLHAGASAKVLWAFLPDAEIQRILNAIELPALQPGAITDRNRLCDELVAIRQRGYAVSFEETDPGAMGIAAPVYDQTGRPVAGIGVAAPLARIPAERVPAVAPLVVEAARQLSARLGGH
jgi:IclR family transcriptional regulator, KDG regulon repressor